MMMMMMMMMVMVKGAGETRLWAMWVMPIRRLNRGRGAPLHPPWPLPYV